MKRITTLLWGILLMLPGLSYAQNAVNGQVKDAKGMGLPGVNILLKTTNTGTITDAEGNYSLQAPADGVLVFSFIGYSAQEVKIEGRSELNITMKEDLQNLDEVVVTAIGIKQQKKKLGYTTQEVNGQVLEQAKTMNVGSALAGQVAGLTVTNPTGIFQTPSFTLRGKTPLIVLDGIPVETDFYDIASEDIENINVLKGTAASALYGSRGKNGAILITSKLAKKEGLEINLSTNNMMTAGYTVFPKTQTEYGSGSNGKYEFWDGADGGISDGDMTWGPKFEPGVKIAQWNSPIRNKETGEQIDWWGDVKGTVYDDRSKYERVPIDWVQHDNLRNFLSTGYVTTNNLSIAYKGDRSRFYASGKYARQKGQVPNSALSTGSMNFNSSFDLTKTLTLDASMSYTAVTSPNYPRYGYGPKNHMYTILVWMSDDVNGEDLKNHQWIPGQEGYRQANYNYAWYNNPYFAAYQLNQKHQRNVIDGQVKLNWQILPNLSVQGRANVRDKRYFEDMQSPKTYLNYGDSRNGDYKIWNTSQRNVDTDILASYTQPITSNIQMSVNAGASSLYRTYQQEYQSTDGLIVPSVFSLNNTAGPVQATNYFQEKAIRSVYGSANFDFYDAVFLNLTARNDWSSTLPASNNSYFYPSASLSTVVSEYIKMPKAMDFLKVFGSWAQVSSDLSPYSIYSAYSKGVTYGSTPSVYYPSGIINPNIKPEETTSIELGISTALFKNRVSLDFTYYNVTDENQIIDLGVSESSGFSSRKVNGNVYKTNGFEIMGNFKMIRQGNFNWDMGVNWSRYVRKITEIYGDQSKFGNLRVGDRADSHYATVWQKSADGQLILDARGLPTRDPYPVNVGHKEPNFRMGFQNKFKVHDFNIGVDFDGVYGGIIRSLTIEKMWWGGKHPNSVEFRDQEYAAGKPVYVPTGVVVTGGEFSRDVDGNVINDSRTYEPNTTAVDWQTWSQQYPYRAAVTESENKKFANIFDRSYVKLRRVSVSYDLAKLINFGPTVKGLEASIFGYNLMMLKKMPILDPDYGDDDNLQDPSSRFLGFSLNLKL
ncbi:TonB-linked SusC/RagA family outer membrane protein [Dyadobacter jejuensis]|uniref:TonB-linked SusC/RagA family outer membrane protein n=1 Tax=Dyadobacter jejuensis TaxID=1082580 RepID=A0A316ARJ2_9BACT|nr:SusC/RagA family TonB-linked outer membrane protein [Dyadobacter jejuensis]PWJ59450.1 TonB-linked SusC/RagA family outer membrane protein [Dyadobacter jejuensis]